MSGFYIQELKLTGSHTEDASIPFEKGLNVISGPSNTGKSFIFKCINYIFGASELKPIKESKKYSIIYLQLGFFNSNRQITLSRAIGDNKIYYSFSGIKNFTTSSHQVLNVKHSAENEDNISRYLLKLLGIEELICLVKSKSNGSKKTLSFRAIVNLFMISETDIISEKKSPILDDIKMNNTYSISVIRYLFKKIDDRLCTEIEKKDIKKAKLDANITYIETKINELIEKKNKYQKRLQNINFGKYNNVENLHEKIKEYETEIINLETEKKSLSELLSELESNRREEILEMRKISKLQEQYNSDLNRLEFIHNGSDLLHQLENGKCPVCNQKWDSEILDKEEHEILQEILEKEHAMIQIKLTEINEILLGYKQKIKENDLEINQHNEELTKINCKIEQLYKNKLTPINNIINRELDYQKHQIELTGIQESINMLVDDKSKIKFDDLNQPDKIEYNFNIDKEQMKIVCKKILDNLNECGYLATTVEFDYKNNDIAIDGELRTTNGKGMRAYLYSVFSLSIMEYFLEIKSPVSKLLILDSPLTTLKEKEKNNESVNLEDEEVSTDLQSALFNLFYKKSKEKQIIIIENKEVNPEIENEINYIEFTKDFGIGRYGFLKKDTI